MAKTKRKNVKKVRKPKPMKIAALIVSAIQDLRETKGSTPRRIAGYISFASKVPEGRVKRQPKKFKAALANDIIVYQMHQVNAALKRGVEYGILRRYRGHYFLPSGDELDRANRIAVRFARLPTPAPSSIKSSIGQAARRVIESAGEMGGPKTHRNLFTNDGKWPTRSHSLPASDATSCSDKIFDRDELSIGSDIE